MGGFLLQARRRAVALAAIAGLVGAALGPLPARATTASESNATSAATTPAGAEIPAVHHQPVDDRILVTFDAAVGPGEWQNRLAGVASGPLERIGVRSYRLPVPPGTASAAVEALRRATGVRAELDHPLADAAQPNDSYYGEQWAMADTYQYATTHGVDVNAEAAWAATTGSSGVVVGILDTGINLSHPDLVGNLWANPGTIGGCPAGTHGYDPVSGDCTPEDGSLHGTHVAGIIGARGNNGLGVAGVAWNVQLMGLRTLDGSGGGTTSDFIEAIHWAVNAKRAGVNLRVLNASLGGEDPSQALSDEIAWAGANDILLVAAAGNGGADGLGDDVDVAPEYPCAFPLDNVVCVANTNSNDHLSPHSNFGATQVDLAAPGTDILSTVPPAYAPANNGGYRMESGTSMAAPFVTGAAALALSQGYLSVAQLKARLLAAVDPVPALAGLVASGGRLNLCKAVSGCVAPAPAYDNFESAYDFSSGQGGRQATSRDATRQAGEPAHGTHTVWYSAWYTGGTLSVDAATGYRSRLSVYTGSALDSLTLVAADDPGWDHRINLVVPVSQSKTFRIALASDDGGYGPYSLSVQQTQSPYDPLPKQAFVPDAATGLSASAGDGTAEMTWDAPADHRSALTGYTVRRYRNGVTDGDTAVAAGDRHLSLSGLTNGATYSFRVAATNSVGTGDFSAMSARVVPRAPDVPPPPDPGIGTAGVPRFGYWLLDAAGGIHAFGDAPNAGDPAPYLGGAEAVDIEPSPSGRGYWVVDNNGRVYPFGEPLLLSGGVGSGAGRVVSMSATPTGKGYWLFTDRGEVFAYGDAPQLGDLRGRRLNAPVLDSIPTPSGLGYYMVAADGGIFAFGDANFRGSMGGIRLNSPVQSLVPDGDGDGYWLVAADGGVFAFAADFRGSMGGRRLNRPVTGMVRYGNGYLMVAEDGGIFNFSDRPFSGSLGASPPARPIVAVAALPA